MLYIVGFIAASAAVTLLRKTHEEQMCGEDRLESYRRLEYRFN